MELPQNGQSIECAGPGPAIEGIPVGFVRGGRDAPGMSPYWWNFRGERMPCCLGLRPDLDGPLVDEPFLAAVPTPVYGFQFIVSLHGAQRTGTVVIQIVYRPVAAVPVG